MLAAAQWTQAVSNPPDTSWANAGNWSTNQVPQTTDGVTFSRPQANDTVTNIGVTANGNANITINSLTISKTTAFPAVSLGVGGVTMTISKGTAITGGAVTISGGTNKFRVLGGGAADNISATINCTSATPAFASVQLNGVGWQADGIDIGSSSAKGPSRLYLGGTASANIFVDGNGHLEGNGQVAMVDVRAGGDVAPGNLQANAANGYADQARAGTITAVTGFNFEANSTLTINVGHTSSSELYCNEFGETGATATIDPASTLYVNELPGFVPTLGMEITIIKRTGQNNPGKITGTFLSVRDRKLPAQWEWITVKDNSGSKLYLKLIKTTRPLAITINATEGVSFTAPVATVQGWTVPTYPAFTPR